eukprot:TRINITY_DN84673_c0_g1_i1.p1 TRINITY_DN84673_c0_g1~~TRINITY_DN84673_c0_g1_i1.p1  ORF type:complete len:444 (-),score=33.10 TRINITY_DN84673_c0_g1_i1:123-1397(-)
MGENVAWLQANRIPELVDGLVENLVATKPLHPLDFLKRQIETQIKNAEPPRPRIVFVLGGPGSGKGTQCAKLVKTFGCAHMSAGDLLRAEVDKGTEVGKSIHEAIVQGKIVPGSVTLPLIKQAILELPKGTQWALVDGFPRNIAQALDFESTVGECSFVLNFEVDDEQLVSRLLERGKTSGRADDNLETIKKRLETFHMQTQPVIEYFKAVNKVRMIPAGGSVAEVWGLTRPYFIPRYSDPRIVFVLGPPGCGKGTHCSKITRVLAAKHISSGELLRDEVQSGSVKGKEIAQIMAEGKMVPNSIIMELLLQALTDCPAGTRFLLLDGFPRTMAQALLFEKDVARCAFVLALSAPNDELKQRLENRLKNEGRDDDKSETVEKRLQVYNDTSRPVLEYFRATGKLREVSTDAPQDEVSAKVLALFQ